MSRRSDEDDDIAAITRRMSVKGLSIHDIAEVCGNIVKKERVAILQHVNRLFKLAEIKAHKPVDDEARIKRLLVRIGMLESEVRQLWKKVGQR